MWTMTVLQGLLRRKSENFRSKRFGRSVTVDVGSSKSSKSNLETFQAKSIPNQEYWEQD